jgi:hypothetical protein
MALEIDMAYLVVGLHNLNFLYLSNEFSNNAIVLCYRSVEEGRLLNNYSAFHTCLAFVFGNFCPVKIHSSCPKLGP